MSYIWEALTILFIGFCLLRLAGKKTVAEMTGLEIITLLSIASVIGHAVSMEGIWETAVTLIIFVALLVTVQFLAIKYNFVEKLFMGRATIVIQDGKLLESNLRKLRMSVDQLETKLREKGIVSFSDVKMATIEMNGGLGYELMPEAKPVTVGELNRILSGLRLHVVPPEEDSRTNLFQEVAYREHQHDISRELE
ncbi:DUF421 domain-containing protein [Paenibacillus hamazuiensis]|uniref:DUF421 domain-containing protein n=1 Tax=Paenibacillus hamazuiensis TaxID=2936508 RepID=UPI00200EE602|nr:YetF domain-containing protein [Paenibacillus hamazuiensis]